MYITSSLIKDLLVKGNEREDVCPSMLYYKYVKGLRDIAEENTNQHKGLFFETLLIGGTSNSKEDYSKPSYTNKGTIRIAYQRLMQQANIGKLVFLKNNIIANESNTQVTLYKRWNKNEKVILKMTADIFPTPIYRPIIKGGKPVHHTACIDIKLGGVNSTYGDYCWGTPQYIDQIQAMLYYNITKNLDIELNKELGNEDMFNVLDKSWFKDMLSTDMYQFYYLVFDHKPENGHKFIRYEHNDIKQKWLDESIRKTVNLLEYYNSTGWDANPIYNVCKKCPAKNFCRYKSIGDEI